MWMHNTYIPLDMPKSFALGSKTSRKAAVSFARMPKYLVQGSYTDQGLKGLMKVGGSKRRAMVEQVS